MKHQWLPQAAGPLLFLLVVLMPTPPGMTPQAQYTAGIAIWMAVWWIAEIVPPAVTALLPLVLFPLCGVMPLKSASAEFGNDIIFLFLAGFLFGRAIERWNLHARIALRLVLWLGNSPAQIVLGFMVATAFISMWISNTATAVMMTPVAIAVSQGPWVAREGGRPNFNKALMLGVAYACSIGGMATIVGTPTNAIFLGFVQQEMHVQVSFWQWFIFGFPFATVLLLACWWMLVRMFPLEKDTHGADYRHTLEDEMKAIGPLTAPERRLMAVFGMVIAAWISGSLLWYRWVPNCNDTVVAVTGAMLLFFIPAGNAQRETPLLDWDSALRIHWGVLLFFGGGLALAKGFDVSGLAKWMGGQMESLNNLPPLLILLAVLAVVTLLSELASNIATASMMMPVLAVLASAIGANPFGLLLSATMAASFGFGLPIATAPNSIVFSSGHLTTRDMARAGFLLDAVAVVLLTAFVYYLLPIVWGIQM